MLLLTGTAEVWMLAVLAFVYGTAAAVFMPALIGLIPQTVRHARLQEANGLLALTRSIASVAGPAVAGVLVVSAGSGEAIAVDAATFVFSALCLARMRVGAEPAAAASQGSRSCGARAFSAGLRRGWDEVRSRTWLTWGLVAMSTYHVFVLPSVFVLGPALSEEQLNGASSWAAIVACFGIGGVLGNVVALRLPLRRPVFIAALALVGASTQAAIIGRGLGTVGIAASSCSPASASRSSSPSGTSASRSRSRPSPSRASAPMTSASPWASCRWAWRWPGRSPMPWACRPR